MAVLEPKVWNSGWWRHLELIRHSEVLKSYFYNIFLWIDVIKPKVSNDLDENWLNYRGSRMFSRVSFGCGSFKRMSFGRMVIWSQDHLVARSFGRECLVVGHLVACHLVVESFGRVVIWTQGHIVAWSLGRMVIWSQVIWSRVIWSQVIWSWVIWVILTRSFGRESFFCKKGHLQQNLVVFASN
jgi:hypothetical protein